MAMILVRLLFFLFVLTGFEHATSALSGQSSQWISAAEVVHDHALVQSSQFSEQANSLHFDTISLKTQQLSSIISSIRLIKDHNAGDSQQNQAVWLHAKLRDKTTHIALISEKINVKEQHLKLKLENADTKVREYELDGAFAFARRTLNETLLALLNLKEDTLKFAALCLQLQQLNDQFSSSVPQSMASSNPWRVIVPGFPSLVVLALLSILVLTLGIDKWTREKRMLLHDNEADSPKKKIKTQTKKRNIANSYDYFSIKPNTYIVVGLAGLLIAISISYYRKLHNIGTQSLPAPLVELTDNIESMMTQGIKYQTQLSVLESILEDAISKYNDDGGYTSNIRTQMITYTQEASDQESANRVKLTHIMQVTTDRNRPLRTATASIERNAHLMKVRGAVQLVEKLHKIVEVRSTLDSELLRLLDRMKAADEYFLNQFDTLIEHIHHGRTPIVLHALNDLKSRQSEHMRRLTEMLHLAFDLKSLAETAQESLLEVETSLEKEESSNKWSKWKSFLKTTVAGVAVSYFFPGSINSLVGLVATILNNLVVEHQSSQAQDVIDSSKTLTNRASPHIFTAELVARDILNITSNISAQIESIIVEATAAEKRFDDVRGSEYNEQEVKFLVEGLSSVKEWIDRKRNVVVGVGTGVGLWEEQKKNVIESKDGAKGENTIDADEKENISEDTGKNGVKESAESETINKGS